MILACATFLPVAARYEETITAPRTVRLPVELLPPDGFDPARLETWPSVAGRLEFFEGRLLYMPPCGDVQQDTVTDVVISAETLAERAATAARRR